MVTRMMSGIWGDKEATAARLLPDGSVLTRDMGFLDEDGFLFLADRKDDMIISGGYNIWPIELEQVLIEHPGVAAACVVGVPSERWGESPLAGVVRTLDDAGAAVTAEELVALTAKRLGKVKRLSEIVFLDALPVSEAGKVQRAVLREPYWAGRAQQIGGA